MPDRIRSDNNPNEGMDRRRFIQVSAAAGVAGGIGGTASAKPAPQPEKMKKAGDDGLIHLNEREGMSYKKLGRTNFMCSRLVFGCGAALIGGKAVRLLDVAYEAGINFFDVGSNIYYRGSEKHLGEWLKANRHEVWITSKAPLRPFKDREDLTPLTKEQGQELARSWTMMLEASLKQLDQEYMDAYYLMAVGDPELVKCEELYDAFLKAKSEGKVGHYGISTHKRAEECLDAAVETGWFDLAMIAITPAGWYEWESRQLKEGTPPMKDIRPTLEKAGDAGIGLVGMKAGRFLAARNKDRESNEGAFDAFYDEKFAGADLNPFQKAYAFVLEHGVDVVNADMQNFAHLEENIAATAKSKSFFA